MSTSSASQVTQICSAEYNQPLSFLGVNFVVTLLCIFLECVMFVYVAYQTLYLAPRQKRTISRPLTFALLAYHFFVLFYLCIYIVPVLDAGMRGSDLSGRISCYSEILLPLPAGLYFLAFVVFWHLRLNVVFRNSNYEVSRFLNYLIAFLSIATAICGFGALVYSLMITIQKDESDRLNDAFCLSELNNVDFFPYFSDQTPSASAPFYDCETTIFAVELSIWVATCSIPFLNLLIAFSYVRKFYKLFDGMSPRLETPRSDASGPSGTGPSGLTAPCDTETNQVDHSDQLDQLQHVHAQHTDQVDQMRDMSQVSQISSSQISQISQMSQMSASQISHMTDLSVINNNLNPLDIVQDRPQLRLDASGSASIRAMAAMAKIGYERATLGHLPETQKKYIYRICLVAVISTFSTLVSFVLLSVEDDFVVLLHVDAVLNGLLMVSAFHFGSWMFDAVFVRCCESCNCCCCCYKVCCSWHTGGSVQTLHQRPQMERNVTGSSVRNTPRRNDCNWEG